MANKDQEFLNQVIALANGGLDALAKNNDVSSDTGIKMLGAYEGYIVRLEPGKKIPSVNTWLETQQGKDFVNQENIAPQEVSAFKEMMTSPAARQAVDMVDQTVVSYSETSKEFQQTKESNAPEMVAIHKKIEQVKALKLAKEQNKSTSSSTTPPAANASAPAANAPAPAAPATAPAPAKPTDEYTPAAKQMNMLEKYPQILEATNEDKIKSTLLAYRDQYLRSLKKGSTVLSVEKWLETDEGKKLGVSDETKKELGNFLKGNKAAEPINKIADTEWQIENGQNQEQQQGALPEWFSKNGASLGLGLAVAAIGAFLGLPPIFALLIGLLIGGLMNVFGGGDLGEMMNGSTTPAVGATGEKIPGKDRTIFLDADGKPVEKEAQAQTKINGKIDEHDNFTSVTYQTKNDEGAFTSPQKMENITISMKKGSESATEAALKVMNKAVVDKVTLKDDALVAAHNATLTLETKIKSNTANETDYTTAKTAREEAAKQFVDSNEFNAAYKDKFGEAALKEYNKVWDEKKHLAFAEKIKTEELKQDGAAAIADTLANRDGNMDDAERKKIAALKALVGNEEKALTNISMIEEAVTSMPNGAPSTPRVAPATAVASAAPATTSPSGNALPNQSQTSGTTVARN